MNDMWQKWPGQKRTGNDLCATQAKLETILATLVSRYLLVSISIQCLWYFAKNSIRFEKKEKSGPYLSENFSLEFITDYWTTGSIHNYFLPPHFSSLFFTGPFVIKIILIKPTILFALRWWWANRLWNKEKSSLHRKNRSIIFPWTCRSSIGGWLIPTSPIFI